MARDRAGLAPAGMLRARTLPDAISSARSKRAGTAARASSRGVGCLWSVAYSRSLALRVRNQRFLITLSTVRAFAGWAGYYALC